MALAPILCSGSDMITLIQERLAWIMAPHTTLRLLDPPMQLRPLHQLMLWTTRSEDDPGHRWLCRRLITLARELTGPAQPLTVADHTQASAAHGISFVAAQANAVTT